MADNLESQQAAKREARKQAQEEGRKAMQEQREDRKQQTETALKRMESSRPTPTQEENDLAKIGVIVDEKEDDGSGPTIITNTIVANEPLSAHGFESVETREARKTHEREAHQRNETRRQQDEARKQQEQAHKAQQERDQQAR